MRRFIVIVSIAVAVITFSIVHNSYSDDRCNHTCSKCHQITNQEAINLLKDTAPDVKILEIRPSEVKGLWEIDLESKGQKGIIYVDFSKKYVVSGSIIDIKTKANVTQDRFSSINKVDISQIPLDDALVMGDKEAKYRVIVFDDPD
jgi:thiol:disulfide interchange protein DsbC